MLSDLTAGALADAAARREFVSFAQVEAAALAQTPALDGLQFLAPSDHIKVIAEVKRASPSRGDLAPISDPAALARTYAANGASTISVLTEGRKFKGTLDDLRAVRAEVSVPVLRKDFIAEKYQILEARAAGADLVLLIVAALDQELLAELNAFALSLGLTVLVETHSREELHRALDIDAKLIGVNARNLSTFELDRDLFASLVGEIPAGVIKVAESAVRNATDVQHYRDAGADVVLVGEALVTSDPAATLQSFLAV
ncbi:indole-3-glycerol phosphate synthase TrpC [Aurantimicrobium minutum]|uniref:indole-3-glycerol-phosphate synthase n=1 Tax=Aurantimicrobium minutum TaxID=708131 RepID=A0A173LW68_9MICO|nr:indole-3-glycerol phosphate synthase TrpC [Aurantimicrobium minutum]MDH6239394.1 indole-3-glycerol phosphate synthase [Aurantimicrobium minutum]BAU99093.1 indole-3-glycerol-phosphate synthase [Aurantimicrobium minutum]